MAKKKNDDLFEDESINLDELTTEDIIDTNVEMQNETTETNETVDPRRTPSKKGGNKHQIKRASNQVDVKPKTYVQDTETKPVINTNNVKLIKTQTQVVKSKRDKYVPDLTNKKYKIYNEGRLVFDSTSNQTISFQADWLTIGSTKYLYEKINFVIG